MAKTILSVVGARPNFMKIAPILREMEAQTDWRSYLVHTGQHYDDRLSRQFFVDLELPEADENLEVGSGGHGVQTGEIMKRLEPVMLAQKPDLLLVVGDVNSTLAAALVASKLHIPVAHVEAGLRSYDRRMPEEINRIVTDVLSDLLFVTEPAGVRHLLAEGIPESRIFLVGDVMIDSVARCLPRARAMAQPVLSALQTDGYGVITLHRPSNVDDLRQLEAIVAALLELAERIPLIFPVHPRTRARLEQAGLLERLKDHTRLRLVPPLGYLEFLGLLASSHFVLTDSGGIQAEAVYLQLPCLTLRDSTERPLSVELGINRLLGTAPQSIVPAVEALLRTQAPQLPPHRQAPQLMDGQAAPRIINVLRAYLEASTEGGGPTPTPI